MLLYFLSGCQHYSVINDMNSVTTVAATNMCQLCNTISHNHLNLDNSISVNIRPHILTLSHRHVMLPKEIAKRVPKTHLMSETEWRNLGVQQSQGWVHYMIHQPGIQSL